ncbi:MAG: hypothetical protein M1834_005015 [Cirrosporium novae-zelandiae]|nr:MAG: hypothetical protein M1834_005015 [Cirrosporium novae-zelandiae]
MSASAPLIQSWESRHTIYQLSNSSTISDEKIKEVAEKALLNVPSSFNSQSTRLVILLKKDHEQLWDFTKEILKPIVGEGFAATEAKLNGFRAAYGTILFYEDPVPVQELQKNFALYADRFPVWSEHTSAMHQFALWTALDAEGLGANLQHYSPLVDEKISKTWNVPAAWSLKGQLVFGKPAGGAHEKTQKPLEERLFVHGA